jgi:signal-transduction protein with cAMP-binding, CBS, and nucleotidyltransferase domain
MEGSCRIPGVSVRKYKPLGVIFQAEEHADTAYIIRQGKIEISRQFNGQKVVLDILGPGAIFGEMALLIDDQQRTATAMSLDDSELVVLSRSAFQQYVKQCPTVIATLLRALSQRLKETTNRVRPDNAYAAVCGVLNLLLSQGVTSLPIAELLKSLSTSLFLETNTILSFLQHLLVLELVTIEEEVDGETLYFRQKEDFFNKAIKNPPSI